MRHWAIALLIGLAAALPQNDAATGAIASHAAIESLAARSATAKNAAVDDATAEDAPPDLRPLAPLRPLTACPEDVRALSEMLIRDIPDYTNRVLQRTVAVLPDSPESELESDDLAALQNRGINRLRRPYRPSYVLVAGALELTPLDLNDYAFTTSPEAGGPLTQIFFTTLSRQYTGLRAAEVQEYHWLFLVRASDGWRLAFMFSEVDDPNAAEPPLPPRESSRGSVGQATKLWLRDCRAGAVVPLEPDREEGQ